MFSYLAYAEQLAGQYKAVHAASAESDRSGQATVNLRPSRSPSDFAAALAQQLSKHHSVGSDVYCGNDGFCVDLALHHPQRIEDVTIGVLCDGTRFQQAEDPIEWEVFRTSVLESQGWQLHRLWTPHFFRDSQCCIQRILHQAAELMAKEENKDALKVVKSAKSGGA